MLILSIINITCLALVSKKRFSSFDLNSDRLTCNFTSVSHDINVTINAVIVFSSNENLIPIRFRL